MCDVLVNKQKFRTFNVIDDYNREVIAIEAAHTLSVETVIRLIGQIIQRRVKPEGSEVTMDLNFWVKN